MSALEGGVRGRGILYQSIDNRYSGISIDRQQNHNILRVYTVGYRLSSCWGQTGNGKLRGCTVSRKNQWGRYGYRIPRDRGGTSYEGKGFREMIKH